MRTTIYMPDELHEVMTKYTALHDTNNSELVCNLVRDFLTNPFNWEDLQLYEVFMRNLRHKEEKYD